MAHPFAEKRERHFDDMVLRAAGFTIWERVPGREPQWMLNHVIFSQSEALEYIHNLGEMEGEVAHSHR